MVAKKKKEKEGPKKRSDNKVKSQTSKPRTLKEALGIALNKEYIVRNENGKIKEKTTFLEALAKKMIADAIENDGPTRRLLLKQEFLDLEMPEEQKVENTPEEQKIIDVETKYGELLRQWTETPPKIQEEMSRRMSQALIDELNDMTRSG